MPTLISSRPPRKACIHTRILSLLLPILGLRQSMGLGLSVGVGMAYRSFRRVWRMLQPRLPRRLLPSGVRTLRLWSPRLFPSGVRALRLRSPRLFPSGVRALRLCSPRLFPSGVRALRLRPCGLWWRFPRRRPQIASGKSRTSAHPGITQSIAVQSAPPFRQNIVQMYAKKVLLPLAFLPIPSMFVVAPSNLVQCVYCKPMRKFSHGQNDGPP